MTIAHKTCLLLLFQLANLVAMTQDNLQATKEKFPLIHMDSLHVHAMMADRLGKWSQLLTPTNGQEAEFPIGRGLLDPAGRFEGYLVHGESAQKIWLYILDLTAHRLLCRQEVAHYKYLAGAMESTRNAWIIDIDGDETLEIVVVENLRDFEFPTDEAPNISGTQCYYFDIEGGVLKYHPMPADFKIPGQMKK